LVTGDFRVACYFLLNHLIGIAVHCEELIDHHFLTDAEGFDWALFLEES